MLDNLAALYVGHDDHTRAALTRFAKKLGLHLDIAREASAAVALAATHDYDAVLFDLGTAPQDGPDFYRALRGERPHLARRAVAITNEPPDEAVLRFLAEARCRWLLKPLNLGAVATAIERACAA